MSVLQATKSAHCNQFVEHQHGKIYPPARCMRDAVATGTFLGRERHVCCAGDRCSLRTPGGCHLLLPGCVSHPELTFHAGLAWPADIERSFYLPHTSMLSAGKCRTVRIWRGGQCVQELADHTGPVQCVLVLPDGGILSGSNDMTIKLWMTANASILSAGIQTLLGKL